MAKIVINQTYKQLFGPDGTLRKDVRYFEVYGGRRSAKSFDVMQVLGVTAMVEPNHFIPCVRKVATTLKDSVFAEVCDFFARYEIPVKINITDKEVKLPNGSRFRCFGLDDAEKMKSLKNPTIIWCEEANELTEEEKDSLDAGLSPTKYPGRMLFTHNPIPQIPGTRHWLQKTFLNVEHKLSKAVINKEANALVLRTWYKDNAFCPPETVKVLEGYKNKNPDKYKLWTLGEFTKVEGCVFTNWDIVASVPNGANFIGYGQDFGFSNDPAALVGVWHSKDEIWIKGLLYKTGLSNAALAEEYKALGVDARSLITADSSEPKSIEDLRRDHGYVGVRGVKKGARYKEDLVNRIKSFKLHLIEGDTDLVREFSTYSWQRDKTGKQLPVLQDGEDHYIDAFIMRMHDFYQHRAYAPGKTSTAALGV